MGASLLSYEGQRFKVGQIVYLRLKVLGFSADFDGAMRAECEPVGKDGKPDPNAAVALYRADESILIESKIVAAEMK